MLKTKGLILTLMVLASPALSQNPDHPSNYYFVVLERDTRWAVILERVPPDKYERLWGPTTYDSCAEYLRTHCTFQGNNYRC